MARAFRQGSRDYEKRIVAALGNPPNIDNVPASLWDDIEADLAKTTAVAIALLFLGGVDEMGKTFGEIDADDAGDAAKRFADKRAAKLARDTTRTMKDRLGTVADEWAGVADDVTAKRLRTGLLGDLRDRLEQQADDVGVTETTWSNTVGENYFAKQFGEDELLIVWRTQLDEAVCPICSPLEGTTKDFWGEFEDGPPGHTRCRCYLSVALKDSAVAESILEAFNPDQPRGDDGKWVSDGAISAAVGNVVKEKALRDSVTDPGERKKLDKAIKKAGGGKGEKLSPAKAGSHGTDESTGLPINGDGTVTVYHHTSKANADKIRATGKLKAAAEPDVYVTTHAETDTGYGDTAVPIQVKPESLQLDDEHPNGRKDFRMSVGKPGGSISVKVAEPKQPTAKPSPVTSHGAAVGKPMTRTQANAIQDYTGDKFQKINAALRGGSDFVPGDKAIVSQIDSALSSAPKHQGIVFRKMQATPELIQQLQAGETFTDKAFLSTSQNTPRFIGKDTIALQIVGKNGVDISGVSHNGAAEKEVLFPRDTQFEVVRAERHKQGGWIAILKEKEPTASSESSSPTTTAVQSWAAKKFKVPAHAKAFGEWFGKSAVVNADGTPMVVYHGTSDAFTAFDKQAGKDKGNFGAGPGMFFTQSPEAASGYALQSMPLADKQSVKASEAASGRRDAYYKKLESITKDKMPDGGNARTRWLNDKLDSGAITRQQYDYVNKLQDESYDAHNSKSDAVATPNVMPVHLSIKRPKIIDANGLSWDVVVPRVLPTIDRSKHDGVIFKNITDNGDASEQKTTTFFAFHPHQIKSATGNRGTFDPDNANITESLLESFSESDHPRDDHGKFVSGASIAGAVGSAQKIKKLRDAVTKPAERKKLDAVLKNAGDKSAPAAPSLSRHELPQLSGDDKPQFFDRLKSQGVAVRDTSIPVGQLKGVQTDFNPEKVQAMADKIRANGSLGKSRVMVSNDGYVVDGHHRWRAESAVGKDRKLDVTQVDLPASELVKQIAADPKSFKVGTSESSGERQPAVHASPVVKAAEKHYPPANASAVDTKSRQQHADGTYTPQRQVLHDKISSKLREGVPPSNDKTYLVMGGGPASGKSSIIKAGLAKLPDRHVLIDSDSIKAELPEYQSLLSAKDHRAAAFVHDESSDVATRVNRESFAASQNVVLDGTGDGSIDKLEKKTRLAREAGYKVNAEYTTSSIGEALRRNQERAKKTGRLPPEDMLRDTHKAVSKILPEAVKRGLFDGVRLWDTENHTPDGKPTLVMSAAGTSMTVHNPKLWQAFLDKAK